MKFKLIKEVEGEVPVYGGQKMKTGDTVEFDDFFAAKAMKNPDFKEVKSRGKKANGDADTDN